MNTNKKRKLEEEKEDIVDAIRKQVGTMIQLRKEQTEILKNLLLMVQQHEIYNIDVINNDNIKNRDLYFEEPNIIGVDRRVGTSTVICAFIVACFMYIKNIKICLVVRGQRESNKMVKYCMRYFKKISFFKSINIIHDQILLWIHDHESIKSIFAVSDHQINNSDIESNRGMTLSYEYDFVICDKFLVNLNQVALFLHRCMRSKSLVSVFKINHLLEPDVSIILTELNIAYQQKNKNYKIDINVGHEKKGLYCKSLSKEIVNVFTQQLCQIKIKKKFVFIYLFICSKNPSKIVNSI
jgi:hypothetical protein